MNIIIIIIIIIIIKLIDECCLTASPEIVWKIIEINVSIPAVDDESPELLLNHFGGHTRRRKGAVPSTHCLSRNPAKSNSDAEPAQRRHEKMLLHRLPKLLLTSHNSKNSQKPKPSSLSTLHIHREMEHFINCQISTTRISNLKI